MAERAGARLLCPGSDPAEVYRRVHRDLIVEALGAMKRPELPTESATECTARERFGERVQRLGDLHQTLLSFSPVIDAEGTFTLVPNLADRKRRGAYFTPWQLALTVAHMAIEPVAHGADPPTVLDPAMGAGTLLLAAAWVIHRNWGMPLRDVAETRLFGVDRDPLAQQIAVSTLACETGAQPRALARHLIHGDLLAGTPPPTAAPEVVIGNPPWGTGAHGRSGDCPDPFKQFLALGADLAVTGLTMILPRAVLLQQAHVDVRAHVLSRLAPRSALLLENNAFHGSAAPACVLTFQSPPGPLMVSIVDRTQPGEHEPYSVPASRWHHGGFAVAREDVSALVDRIQHALPALGALRPRYRVRDAGLNYNRASVAARSLYRGPAAEHAADYPVYRGRDFARYTVVSPSSWLRHDAFDRLEPGETLYVGAQVSQASEYIVLRQTSDRIVATLNRSRMLPGRSTLAITGNETASLPALLACLNSHLLTVLYRVLAGETGRILPQVKVGRLNDLPVPPIAAEGFPPPPSAPGAALWLRLHDLSTAQIARGSPDPAIDREIDALVEDLYGLTDGEKRLIQDN